MPKHRCLLRALSLGSAALLMAAPVARADEINNAHPIDAHAPAQVLADAEPEITDRIPVETVAADVSPVEVQQDEVVAADLSPVEVQQDEMMEETAEGE
jgi:hypothetical protein